MSWEKYKANTTSDNNACGGINNERHEQWATVIFVRLNIFANRNRRNKTKKWARADYHTVCLARLKTAISSLFSINIQGWILQWFIHFSTCQNQVIFRVAYLHILAANTTNIKAYPPFAFWNFLWMPKGSFLQSSAYFVFIVVVYICLSLLPQPHFIFSQFTDESVCHCSIPLWSLRTGVLHVLDILLVPNTWLKWNNPGVYMSCVGVVGHHWFKRTLTSAKWFSHKLIRRRKWYWLSILGF